MEKGGGVYSLSCLAAVVWPLTLAALQCRDGARRVFTEKAYIDCLRPSAKRREVFGEAQVGRAASN